jgi:hypothetical protein
MRHRIAVMAVAALPLALLATIAPAHDRPMIVPTRDVSIVYRAVGGPKDGQEAQVSWLAGERHVRVDLAADRPGERQTMIMNLRGETAWLVRPAQRVIYEAPRGLLGLMMLGTVLILPEARLARVDAATTERIAGHACNL